MLFVTDESTPEEIIYQPLQTNNRKFKLVVKFLLGYNGIFSATTKKIQILFATSVTDEGDFFQKTTPPEAFELESLTEDGKRNIFEDGYFTEEKYRFLVKPNFSTRASVIEISRQEPSISLDQIDSIRHFFSYGPLVTYQQYKYSFKPVDIFFI